MFRLSVRRPSVRYNYHTAIDAGRHARSHRGVTQVRLSLYVVVVAASRRPHLPLFTITGAAAAPGRLIHRLNWRSIALPLAARPAGVTLKCPLHEKSAW